MKDKLIKFRKRVDWVQVLNHLSEILMTYYAWKMKKEFNDRWYVNKIRKFSDNRVAYLTLLHYFDKKILDAYRLTGDINVFYHPEFIGQVRVRDSRSL